MKKTFIWFIVMTAVIALQAQPAQKKAEEILDKAAAKTASYTSFKIEFTYSLINDQEKINESQDGSIISKGDKYKLSIAGQEIVSDGKTVWSYSPETNEVIITSPSPEDEESINLTKLLNNYKTSFKSKFIKEETINGKVVQVIDMTPVESKSYFKIRIKIDKAKQQIYSVAFFDRSNNVFTYTVKKFTPNVSAPDTLFRFDAAKHPGVVEVDMR